MIPRLTMIALAGSRPGRTTPQRPRDGSISPRLAAKRGVAQNERFVKILDAGQANAAGRRRRKTTAIAATSFPVLRSIVCWGLPRTKARNSTAIDSNCRARAGHKVQRMSRKCRGKNANFRHIRQTTRTSRRGSHRKKMTHAAKKRDLGKIR